MGVQGEGGLPCLLPFDAADLHSDQVSTSASLTFINAC